MCVKVRERPGAPNRVGPLARRVGMILSVRDAPDLWVREAATACQSRSLPIAHRIIEDAARSYDRVAQSRPAHDALLRVLDVFASDCDLLPLGEAIEGEVQQQWKALAVSGSDWMYNVEQLLQTFFVAQQLPCAPFQDQRASHNRRSVVAMLAPFVAAVVAQLADTMEAAGTAWLNNDDMLIVLERVLRIMAVADVASFSEATAARLNSVIHVCTEHLQALAVSVRGAGVACALVDDLARGLKARRHVMDTFVRYACNAVANRVVVALLDHSAKISKTVGSLFLADAPDDLVAEFGLEAPCPAIAAFACHSHAVEVVRRATRYADGYYAVSFAEVLLRWQAQIAKHASDSAVARAAVAWATGHPTFSTAVIANDSRLARDIIVNRQHIFPTAALLSIDQHRSQLGESKLPQPHRACGKVCFAYCEGKCDADQRCNMLHIEPEVIAHAASYDCCFGHHEAATQSEATNPDITLHFTDAQGMSEAEMAPIAQQSFTVIDSVRHFTAAQCTGRELSFTAGLAAYLARDFDVGIPIASDLLCRQHRRGGCHKPSQCKYIHVCRRLYDVVQQRVRDSPSPTTPPTQGQKKLSFASGPDAAHAGLPVAASPLSHPASVRSASNFGDGSRASYHGDDWSNTGRSQRQSEVGSVDESPLVTAMRRSPASAGKVPGPSSATSSIVSGRTPRRQHQPYAQSPMQTSAPPSPLPGARTPSTCASDSINSFVHHATRPPGYRPPSQASSHGSRRTLPECKYWRLGTCSKGTRCSFLHSGPAPQHGE